MPGQMLDKQRVSQFGEVFTPAWMVDAMLGLVKEETERIDSLFLEPACGTGNFLVEILKRKLAHVKNDNDIIRCVRSLYGIELLPDNAATCRERLFEIVLRTTSDAEILQEARTVIAENIVCGDALDEKNIIFTDWKSGHRVSLWQIANEKAQKVK